MGVHDGAGGFFAEDLGFRRGVEACAEVSAVELGRSVYGGAKVSLGKVRKGGGGAYVSM